MNPFKVYVSGDRLLNRIREILLSFRITKSTSQPITKSFYKFWNNFVRRSKITTNMTTVCSELTWDCIKHGSKILSN